jgi:hypothetical protein
MNKPIFNATAFVKDSGIPAPTARRILALLSENELIRPLREASGRRHAIFMFPELLNITEGRDVF